MDRNQYSKIRLNLMNETLQNKCQISILDQLQETHYIVPADNLNLIEKAIKRGCSTGLELLSRYGISLDDISMALDCTPSLIQKIIETNYHSDLILIDGEDATSLSDENIKSARKNIISTFNERKNYHTRMYFRPSGLELKYCIDDIVEVLSGVKINQEGAYPVDGMIYPKVESKEEINFINNILLDFEREIKIPENTIKLQFLVESSRGVEKIYEIASSIKSRLSGIIFGMADYAADIGISSLNENHPLFQYAKMRIVNVSAAMGVPSVDCMNFRYPVADKNLNLVENKELILNRMRQMHDTTLNSISLGMKGKWVGHPLQLLAAKVAFEKVFSQELLGDYMKKLKIYSESSSGTKIIDNDMADRATDRNVRTFLRRAVIKSKIDIEIALNLGLINNSEFTMLKLRQN